MDASTSTCVICCQFLDRYPTTGDFATPDMALARLPCKHMFHADCLYSCKYKLQHVGHGTCDVQRVRMVERCPMCRHPWGVDEAEDLLLLDLEVADQSRARRAGAEEAVQV